MRDGDAEYVVERGTDAWRASMEWARFHGLDPMRIPAGSVVERDAVGRRILFTEFLKDGPGAGDIVIVDGEPVEVECVEQGEAPPIPFPREVTG
jgi:hypothetical protein